MKRLLILSIALAAVAGTAAAQRPRERLRDRLAPHPPETLYEATTVLADLSNIPAKGIPAKLLADAQGVAIIPRVVKAGFVVAGSGGRGVVLVRDKDGGWGDPTFVRFGGGSVGFQAGVESTDVVLVFRDRKSLDRVLDGKGKLTLGADAGVAAGPVGRQAMAGTDIKLAAEVLSYSRSRGLFAGVALDGSVIHADAEANTMFRADARPEVARQVAGLKEVLTAMSSATPPARAVPVAPAPEVLLPPVPAPAPGAQPVPPAPAVPPVPVIPLPPPGR
jgi:lipid-binding SYLF domain-containing protein